MGEGNPKRAQKVQCLVAYYGMIFRKKDPVGETDQLQDWLIKLREGGR